MSFVFPVVGATEWSGGSYMPGTLTHRGRTHAAVDIYAESGALIVTPVAGKVKSVGSGSIGGNWITVQGDDGNTYYYAHMLSPSHLASGDTIAGGSSLGFVGNSGSASSTSPHLHFSVKRNGVEVDPRDMLENAVLVPDFEQQVTGVGPSSRGAVNVPTTGDWVSQVSTPYDDDTQPAWIDQLNQARQDRLNRPGEEPRKVRAAEIVRGTLRGMAQMVRSQGFQTGQGDPSGIDEDQGIVQRVGER